MSAPIHGQNSTNNSVSPAFVSENALHVAQYVWDTNTLSWIKQSGSSGGVSSDVTVVNFPATQNISGSVSAVPYQKIFDSVSDTLAYLGESLPGTATTTSTWRIQQLSFTPSGGVVTRYADGNANFDNVWDDRASLSY